MTAEKTDSLADELSRMPRPPKGYKAFCHKCGFPWARGLGCAQCQTTLKEAKVSAPKKQRVRKKKTVRKVDKRTKVYRDRLRSKVIWELAELVMALNSVLEYDDFGRVIFYERQQDRAGLLKERVPTVMIDVRRAYETSKRYSTKTLKKIRANYPLHMKAYHLR